jgi:hypothetical protein
VPIERKPKKPLRKFYVPAGGIPYKVRDGDSWKSVATKFKIDVKKLIWFNFQTTDSHEVNWYLRENVGCKKQTKDKNNWVFSAAAYPGFIYIPPPSVKSVPKKAPTTKCLGELKAAEATLKKSQRIASTILSSGATSDMPYWFARLYQYITMYEIKDRSKLSYPCFLLHFIPIFYDTYAVAAEAFKSAGTIPGHWREHFGMAKLIVDPTTPDPWARAVTKSLVSGVKAHIKVDMAPSLEKAYRTFDAKYTSVPSFDTYKPDFFGRNRVVFAKVRDTIINEIVNRGLGMAARGRSVDPKLANKAGKILKIGLQIDEIYDWREVAWKTAKSKLGG